MGYIKCSHCGINWMDDKEEYCVSCKQELAGKKAAPHVEDNKYKVERDLLPILRGFSEEGLQSLALLKDSFELLGLRLPLLVECKGNCSVETKVTTKDGISYGRYYIEPYDINGVKYHICSQWWSAVGNNSKDILNLLVKIKEK